VPTAESKGATAQRSTKTTVGAVAECQPHRLRHQTSTNADELNVVADALSRLQAPSPKPLPEVGRGAKRLEGPKRPDSWYRLLAAPRGPDLGEEKKGLAAWEAINGFE
jgi:hypothetical protein